jgi:hypothetical protein
MPIVANGAGEEGIRTAAKQGLNGCAGIAECGITFFHCSIGVAER